ncbi:MAG: methyltransferase [Actinobacteria bacterium]|nr:methyltransferase [Actinomycetota bacterium]
MANPDRPFHFRRLPWADFGDSRPGRDGHLVVACDSTEDQPLPSDHVMGVGGASRTLLTLTPRRPMATALDLGSGCGIGALLLAAHADYVVASDVSPRALMASRATCKANGLSPDDVATVRASFTDAFAADSFDLVTSNPPFVISPGTGHEYRESPLPGDSLTPTLVAGIRRVLRPGGWAVVLTSWLQRTDEVWEDRLTDWLPTDCHGWVARRDVLESDAYVDFWLRDSGHSGDTGLRTRWHEYLDSLGADGVGFGWIVLHRPPHEATSPVHWAEDVAGALRVPAGDEVEAEFARRIDCPSATEVLASTPRRAPGVEVVAIGSAAGATGVPDRASLLTQPGGWRPPEPLDPALSWLFAASLDVPLARQLHACADDLGMDPTDVLVSWLPGLRGLIERGFVTLDLE